MIQQLHSQVYTPKNSCTCAPKDIQKYSEQHYYNSPQVGTSQIFSRVEWINIFWRIHKMEYHTEMKIKKQQPYTATWMDLTNIMTTNKRIYSM